MYSLEWSVSKNGKNTTLIFYYYFSFPHKNQNLSCFMGEHSKRVFKCINMTKPRARKKNYKFPSLDTMNSFQTAHHIYPQQSEQGLMYNWKSVRNRQLLSS